MKVVNIGNIAETYICDDLPATGIVIEATIDELKRLPNLAYKDVSISATPRRNCDVGTAEEQWKRFDEFCDAWQESAPVESCSDKCPVIKMKNLGYDGCQGRSGCYALWAQLPYAQEGGAK